MIPIHLDKISKTYGESATAAPAKQAVMGPERGEGQSPASDQARQDCDDGFVRSRPGAGDHRVFTARHRERRGHNLSVDVDVGHHRPRAVQPIERAVPVEPNHPGAGGQDGVVGQPGCLIAEEVGIAVVDPAEHLGIR